MEILSARLAELILQLHSLRDQLRSAVFQTIRETVVRIAGDAIDRLWRAKRQRSYSAYDDPDDRWRHDDFDHEDDERSWSPRREPKPDSVKRNETQGKVLRAGRTSPRRCCPSRAAWASQCAWRSIPDTWSVCSSSASASSAASIPNGP